MAFHLRELFKKQEKHDYDAHPTKLGKVWHFIAHEESIASFIVDAILILAIGKFVIIPLIGFLLSTSFPLVAVVSSSMDHNANFDDWWAQQSGWYEMHNISKEQFKSYPYANGFNKGDVFVVKGAPIEKLKVGDVIVFTISGKRDPIIHRIVAIDIKNKTIQTKGDANPAQIDFELDIKEEQVKGKAVIRVPLIGWIKVAFIDLVNILK
ncbi:MAG: signal peptidase I [Candidatus Nanoarchaeia archaeon]